MSLKKSICFSCKISIERRAVKTDHSDQIFLFTFLVCRINFDNQPLSRLKVLQFKPWSPRLSHIAKNVLLLAVPELKVEGLFEAPTPSRVTNNGERIIGLQSYTAISWRGGQTLIIFFISMILY